MILKIITTGYVLLFTNYAYSTCIADGQDTIPSTPHWTHIAKYYDCASDELQTASIAISSLWDYFWDKNDELEPVCTDTEGGDHEGPGSTLTILSSPADQFIKGQHIYPLLPPTEECDDESDWSDNECEWTESS